MTKLAPAEYALHPLIAARWSPRSFANRPISSSDLRTMLEAARWAPSRYNEQPWRILVATKDDPEAHARALACLSASDRRWAHRAWGLIVACAHGTREASGQPNPHAEHDLGMALAQFALQGTAMEIDVCFLADFDADAARESFAIPAGDAVLCMAAVGHRDSPDALPEELQERERAPRERKPQARWVFGGRHGEAWAPREERQVEGVLDFWFGGQRNGHAGPDHAERWWTKDPEFDAEIRRRFESLYDEVRRGEHEDWLRSARGRLASIIILDQFPRNMFRGTARMYESDGLALERALSGIELGFDRALPGDLRAFFYMPLMHAESRATQDACVRLFRDFANSIEDGDSAERIRNNLKYAELHRDVVLRFGRFPHRNEILGRASSPDEIAFLEGGGPTF